MADYLLLGAGFSRNWGGWLANEAFEYLLGCPEVAADPRIGALLWQYQSKGGFEMALAKAWNDFKIDPANHTATLNGLQAAIERMFADMNKALMETVNFDFRPLRDISVVEFLARFDAIFTLNQDILLEDQYALHVPLSGRGKWRAGAALPAIHDKLVRDMRFHEKRPIFRNRGGASELIPRN